MKKPRITKAQLTVIIEALAAGIPLTVATKRGIRTLYAGQITGQIDRGWACTTLSTDDMMSCVQFGPLTIAALAAQAAAKLARKDEVLAEQRATVRRALDLS